MRVVKISGLFIVLSVGLVNSTYGQNRDDAATRIVTNPVGAMVYLEGEYNLAGRAPYTITQPLDGAYKIKASKFGFENYSATYRFKQGANEKLAIQLTQKTRLRSLVRSMFFPGWGQYYADQKFKGFFIGTLQLGTVGYLIFTDSDYQKAVNDYNAAVKNFENNQNNAEVRDSYLQQVNDAEAEVDDKYETRRRALLMTASVYIYNLLDAMIFFPSYHNSGLGVSVGLNNAGSKDGLALNIKARF